MRKPRLREANVLAQMFSRREGDGWPGLCLRGEALGGEVGSLLSVSCYHSDLKPALWSSLADFLPQESGFS